MVARGDLGIEVAQEKIPGIQRLLIRKAVCAKKPVIVATQMLHSMIQNPRPTRAEVTDIANAIYYRTDAIMLSGETAYGKYPVEAVRTMSKIAEEAEKTKIPDNDIKIPFDAMAHDVTSFLAKQAADAAVTIGTKAIINDSYSGKTARYLSAYRSTNPVLSICYSEPIMRLLALSYGVFPIFQKEKENAREYFFNALNILLEKQWIAEDDYVSYLSGSYGAGFGTSFLEINQVKKLFAGNKKLTLPNF
jgi:pyruvate kinase